MSPEPMSATPDGEDFERNEVAVRMEPPPKWQPVGRIEDYLREHLADTVQQRMWSEDPSNVLPPLRQPDE